MSKQPAQESEPKSEPANAPGMDADAMSAHEGAVQVLRTRMRDFVTEWTEVLGAEWQCDRAVDLHEKLDQLVACADQLKVASLTEPALELIVYMCSFLEAASYPNRSQHQHMRELVQRLGRALDRRSEKPVRRTVLAQSSKHNIAFYLRREDNDLSGLATQLGQHRYIVHPFDNLEMAVGAASRIRPDVLIVEGFFVPQLHLLIDAIERRNESGKETVACLVLIEAADLDRTLFAQRAGADVVTTQTDPVVLAAQIDEMLVQRRSQSYRVLIVEDDRAQAQFCESVLRHRGMVSQVCATGGEVLAAITEFKPDLVLLDLYLPDCNGIEVAQRVRERPELALLPLVFLSGEHDLDLRFDAIRMGGDDFITKPIKPRHLLLTVESRVRRARLLGGNEAQGGDRRGALVSRETFVRDVERCAGDVQEHCLILAMIAVDGQDVLREHVGFVAMGVLAQQVAVSLGAELRHVHPPCACADLAFLMMFRGSSEQALQQEIDALRERLQKRLWLSAEHTTQLHFTVAGLRLTPEVTNVEALIAKVMRLCRNTQEAGGARTELDLRIPGSQLNDDPQTRVIKSMLRGPMTSDMVRLSFQARVPLTGQLTGQYVVRMVLTPPKFSHSLVLDSAVYGPVANKLGLMPRVDRALFHHALRRLNGALSTKRDLHLIVPVSAQSLFDPAFVPWLVTELRSQQLPMQAIAIEFEALELIDSMAKLDSALDALQRVGVHLSLALQPNDVSSRKLIGHPAFSSIVVQRPTSIAETPGVNAWTSVAHLVSEMRGLGKVIIALGISDMHDLAVLVQLGVHYAQGDLLCPWLAQMSFDFTEVSI